MKIAVRTLCNSIESYPPILAIALYSHNVVSHGQTPGWIDFNRFRVIQISNKESRNTLLIDVGAGTKNRYCVFIDWVGCLSRYSPHTTHAGRPNLIKFFSRTRWVTELLQSAIIPGVQLNGIQG